MTDFQQYLYLICPGQSCKKKIVLQNKFAKDKVTCSCGFKSKVKDLEMSSTAPLIILKEGETKTLTVFKEVNLTIQMYAGKPEDLEDLLLEMENLAIAEYFSKSWCKKGPLLLLLLFCDWLQKLQQKCVFLDNSRT